MAGKYFLLAPPIPCYMLDTAREALYHISCIWRALGATNMFFSQPSTVFVSFLW
jgi:hypothetical protein